MTEELNNIHSAGILDTIIGSETQTNLSAFEPANLVNLLLTDLQERERVILRGRFGLAGQPAQTLEIIGRQYQLTRERVRQIEKDAIKQIVSRAQQTLTRSLQLIFDTFLEHGNVMAENFLIDTLLAGKTDPKDAQALKFLLHVGDQFHFHREDENYYDRWSVVGFNQTRLDITVTEFKNLLQARGAALPQDQFLNQFKSSAYYQQHHYELSDKVLASYLTLAKTVHVNPFNEVGLRDWADVLPRDVGDKAYLALKHHGKPEHYSIITKLINDQKFDGRTAYQETVHNELIKDTRFVLVGRGIYALTAWGYKKGVVADVIKEILVQAGRPLTRDEIIAEVLKRRLVKRNTILVGLSNKRLFQKVDRNKFIMIK